MMHFWNNPIYPLLSAVYRRKMDNIDWNLFAFVPWYAAASTYVKIVINLNTEV